MLALEAAAKSTGAIDTVGTVGVCDVFPGAVNSIPSRVMMRRTFATSTARAATVFSTN
jgi:predicted secreted protein